MSVDLEHLTARFTRLVTRLYDLRLYGLDSPELFELEYLMSQADDVIAAGLASLNAAVARNQAMVADFQKQIADLKGQPSLSAQNIADLGTMKTIADGLDLTTPAVIPAPVIAAALKAVPTGAAAVTGRTVPSHA